MRSPERRGILRPVLAATALMIGAIGLAGCSGSENDAASQHDKQSACMKNGLEGRSLSQVLAVPGEDFKLKATYSTKYDVDSWKITDTKTLDIQLEIEPDKPTDETPADEPIVLIENLHADATVKSHRSATNSMPADSFDDHLHAGDQPGFLISTEHPYREQFVIGGFSETLTSAWGSYVNGYGSWEEEEKRLTEQNLRDNGAYGEELSIVADVLVRDPSEQYFHKDVVTNSFIVPLAGQKC